MPERVKTTTTLITTAHQIGCNLEFFNRILPNETLKQEEGTTCEKSSARLLNDENGQEMKMTGISEFVS